MRRAFKNATTSRRRRRRRRRVTDPIRMVGIKNYYSLTVTMWSNDTAMVAQMVTGRDFVTVVSVLFRVVHPL